MVKAKKGKNIGKDDDIDDENNIEVGGSKRESKNRSKFDNEEHPSKKADKKGKKGRKEEDSDSEEDKYNRKKDKRSGRNMSESDEEEHENVGKKIRKKDLNAGEEDEITKLNKRKSKKDRKKFDFDDDDENGDDLIRANMKKKYGENRDDSEDEERRGKGKVTGKAKKKHEESDEKDGDEDVRRLSKDVEAFEISKSKKKKGKNKSKGDNDEADSDEDFAKTVKSKSQQQKCLESEDENNDEKMAEKSKAAEQEKGGKKGKKNRKKRDDDDDEDIEKALAELELEYAGLKPKEEITKTESEPADEKLSKKAKKAKKDRDEENEFEYSSVISEEITKKRKEKSKKSQKKEESERDYDIKSSLRDRDDDDDKKGKKDKKKKDEKEKKGPGKKTIAAMQEALKKIREEEERLQREEEERIKREEEAEAARQEALRIEREKKEKKKQKEKDRKERLKAEGKLLTAKQKADKARAQELISALKAQGLELPDPGEKKPRPGTRVRPSKIKSATIQESDATDGKEREALANEPDQVQVEIIDTKIETKEESDSDDVKDNWDSDSSGEDISEKINEKQPIIKEEIAPKEAALEEESESESEEEEEDEEDEDEVEEDSSEEESGSEDEHKTDAERRREKALNRIEKRREEAEKNRNPDNLRAAVVCVLGHVDTGKTKILDKLRRTHVQDGEAGGITQQIGATNVPIDNIKETCKLVKGFSNLDLKIPGLLIIDTPGHESFSNLRSRGSSLCDIAILVVDIMHGLEPQTIESINLLKTRKTPFIVALNKIDRLYNWQTGGRKDIRDILKSQADNTQLEFKQRTQEVTVQFAEQGLNAALFFENPDLRSYVSLVPTSAITGEGMGNLLALIVELSQTMLAKRLMYSEWLLATVLEVKAIPGLGTTIDAILINGKMKEGDTMILAGTDGPIVTQIRSLLMPQPMKELRVKNAYVEYKEIKAAQGVKIAAKDLEKAIAGLNLQIAEKPDEVPIFCDEVAKELKNALSSIKLKERGVYVQASTLGSLEALLEFLRTSKIPYSGIRIGPVVKKDVMKASIMLEHESQYATILAFDVKVERDAQELADSLGVKIFQADIIYHLFDKFMAYRDELKQKKRDEFKHVAVFPCKLRILPQFVFNTRDPIVVGVMVEAGVIREGTPLCVPSKEFINLGIVTSVEVNHKPLEAARKGMEVCIKIENPPGETPKLYGRHFDHTDMLISKISRQSIDACKDYFRDDLTKQDWQLMVELKKLFQIL